MSTIAELETFTIFSEMAKIKALKVFEYMDSDTMNLYYKNAKSEKIQAPILSKLTQTEIAKILIGLFAEKWDTTVNYILKANETLITNGEKETKTQTTKGNTTGTNTTINTVTAYDSDEFSNNDKSENNSNEDTTGNLDYTIIRENNNYLEKAINYLKTNFIYDTVFSDVDTIITLSIFDSDN